MEEIVKFLKKERKMIVHICCSVDSWYFLTKMREKYPNESITGFFYNPNICPQSEYLARMIDAKRCCDRLKIEFAQGEYDDLRFIAAARGLENEPEKGKRCASCFDLRLDKTAQEAASRGEKRFTTTLLISPKKDLAQLRTAAQTIAARYDLEFVFEDFRKGGGTQEAFALAREKEAYFQNYCGCAWALIKQRGFATELICAIGGVSGKTAGELRLEALKERSRLENEGQNASLFKRKKVMWSLLSASLSFEKGGERTRIVCDAAPYSASLKTRSRLIFVQKGIARFEKTAGFVVERAIAKPENARAVLGLGDWDITPIFIVEKLLDGVAKAAIESVFSEEEIFDIGR